MERIWIVCGTQLQDVLVLHTLLTAFATARSVDRLGATSTTPLMLSDRLEMILLTSTSTTLVKLSNLLQMASTPTMLMVSPSHMEALVDIFGHVSGFSDNDTFLNGVHNCPCAKYPGDVPPAFVGLDFYCESGMTGGIQGINWTALEDPLWDGYGCSPGNSCCAQAGMPWFCIWLINLVLAFTLTCTHIHIRMLTV